MQNIRVEILKFGSKDQIQSIGLRYEVLRKPIGLFYHPDDLKNEENETHVGAFNGNQIVGILLLKEVSPEILKMRQVAVSEAYQGTGVGGKMVAFLEIIAKENNYHKIELHARETAVKFYLNQGYKKVGDMFEEVGIPHWKMEKNL
jgi:predicted GNAT family N-acyltransferase